MNQKTRVAHLIATNFFGGPEKQIVEHALRINQDKFAVLLISFIERSMANELVNAAKEKNIFVRELFTENPFNPRSVLDLWSILKEEKIDILCTHGYKSNVVGRIASWLIGIPEIAISRGWTGENWKIKLYEKLDKLFLRFADHVVTVSEGQREKVLKLGVKANNLSVIYNGINLNNVKNRSVNYIRTELGINDNPVIVMSAGRLSPEKNFAGLIDAAKIVTAKDKNIRFVVFGEGFLREELEKKTRDADLEGKFFLPGFRKDFVSLLREADIFVLPSFTEGLSNVILEAYASKKPVIATRVGGNPEVVMNGETGYLVEPDNAEKMAECIMTLAQDPDLRATMGAKGYEYVKEHFSFDIQTRKYEELYYKILDHRPETTDHRPETSDTRPEV